MKKLLLQVSVSQELLDLYTERIAEGSDSLESLKVEIKPNNFLDIRAKVKAGFVPMNLQGRSELQENVYFDLDDTFRVHLIDFNFILRLLTPILNSEKSKKMGVTFNRESVNISLKQFFRATNLEEVNEMVSTVQVRSVQGEVELKAFGKSDQAREELIA